LALSTAPGNHQHETLNFHSIDQNQPLFRSADQLPNDKSQAIKALIGQGQNLEIATTAEGSGERTTTTMKAVTCCIITSLPGEVIKVARASPRCHYNLLAVQVTADVCTSSTPHYPFDDDLRPRLASKPAHGFDAPVAPARYRHSAVQHTSASRHPLVKSIPVVIGSSGGASSHKTD